MFLAFFLSGCHFDDQNRQCQIIFFSNPRDALLPWVRDSGPATPLHAAQVDKWHRVHLSLPVKLIIDSLSCIRGNATVTVSGGNLA